MGRFEAFALAMALGGPLDAYWNRRAGSRFKFCCNRFLGSSLGSGYFALDFKVLG